MSATIIPLTTTLSAAVSSLSTKQATTSIVSKKQYKANVIRLLYLLYSCGIGYYVAIQPTGTFRHPFSWHPFLMTVGMIGCTGMGAITKKLGGYTNTKNHGTLESIGMVLGLGGLYAIYRNKNNIGKPHFTSYHSYCGLLSLSMCLALGLLGALCLHPDFGVLQKNQTIRMVHKLGARVFVSFAWITCLYGLLQMNSSLFILSIYGIPLLLLFPITLL